MQRATDGHFMSKTWVFILHEAQTKSDWLKVLKVMDGLKFLSCVGGHRRWVVVVVAAAVVLISRLFYDEDNTLVSTLLLTTTKQRCEKDTLIP